MTDAFASDFEGMLKRALTPVEPPETLIQRLETTLTDLSEIAAEELEGGELKSMRDPRNWARPVAAAASGTGAGVGLVILRTRRNHRKRAAAAANPVEFADATLRAMAHEARRLLEG